MTNFVEVHVPTELESDFTSPWGPIGGPPRRRNGAIEGMDSTFLLTPDVLANCLQFGGSEVDGIVGTADMNGYLTMSTEVGTWKYELFPVRFDDGLGPEIYLAVWPD